MLAEIFLVRLDMLRADMRRGASVIAPQTRFVPSVLPIAGLRRA